MKKNNKNDNSQLSIGDELIGERADYRLKKTLAYGGYCETYKAEVIAEKVKADELIKGTIVVVKFPNIDEENFTRNQVIDRLGELFVQLRRERAASESLKGVTSVARLLDEGYHSLRNNETDKAPFQIQEFIDGQQLEAYMKTRYSRGSKFNGISDAAEFFNWAKKLFESLQKIHQKVVIHGDIWPPNILIKNDEPFFIDFGEAHFRNLVFGISNQIRSRTFKGSFHPYMPPERRGKKLTSDATAGGDIYSMGGVLFKLATGEDPPHPVRDIEKLKQKIAKRVREKNPALYSDNCGVVDIIARCLRYSQIGQLPRYRHTESVIQEIEVFSFKSTLEDNLTVDTRLASLGKDLKELDLKKGLFPQMARHRLRLLLNDISDMKEDVYDHIGSHEDIISCLTQCLSLLENGDRYYTITIPDFWRPQNLGINGRFLTMNKLAAQRGVTVRRVFLITSKEKRDVKRGSEFLEIVKSHKRVARELKTLGTNTTDKEIEKGGFYTGWTEVDQKTRDEHVQKGEHFGLLIKGQGRKERKTLIIPIHSQEKLVVAIQFRAGLQRINQLEKIFLDMLQKSKPLEHLTLT
ncbi:MAG: protein kinase domain-containing protein [Thermoleophilia bacterium]